MLDAWWLMEKQQSEIDNQFYQNIGFDKLSMAASFFDKYIPSAFSNQQLAITFFVSSVFFFLDSVVSLFLTTKRTKTLRFAQRTQRPENRESLFLIDFCGFLFDQVKSCINGIQVGSEVEDRNSDIELSVDIG